MKKIIAILTALMLCAAIMVPVFAADDFVPSVTNPLAPEIVPVTDPEGKPAAGVIKAEGEVIEYVYYNHCLVTPASEANTSKDIPDHAKDRLLEVYDKLTSGEMKIPYEKFGADLAPENMVIRDLFDVTFLCEEHPEILKPAGTTFTITFDLGIEAGVDVYCMTYKDGNWNPVVSCVNNGNGTVTVVAENFCPVSISVEIENDDPAGPNQPTEPDETTKPADPDETTKPADPDETTKPADPDETTKPAEPGETTKPAEPGETTKPAEPGETTKPAEPGETTKPTEPGATTKPGDDVEPPVKTGDNLADMMMWGGIALICLIALVALTVAYTRIGKKEEN